jgi:ArsR family transcriptional regulator, virulence genes transcriptional regulator
MRPCACVDDQVMDPIHELQAEVCRILSHPARIAMLHRLAGGPMEVGRLALELGISQPNASQHLAVMRAAGLVEAERDGREVFYRLADPDVIGACEQMANVMRRRLARFAELAARISVQEVETGDGSHQEQAAPATRS